jgi:hypothetical protein
MRSLSSVLRVLALAASIVAGSCDSEETCGPDSQIACGVLKNHVAVTFRNGTPRARVEELNALIGATTVIAPDLSTTYRIKLPNGWCAQRGVAFYDKQQDVVGATAAINACAETSRD